MNFSREGEKGCKRVALNPKAIRKYVEAGGVKCPYCQSEDLQASNQEIDESGIYFDCECKSCLREWKEHYVLAAIMPIETYPLDIQN